MTFMSLCIKLDRRTFPVYICPDLINSSPYNRLVWLAGSACVQSVSQSSSFSFAGKKKRKLKRRRSSRVGRRAVSSRQLVAPLTLADDHSIEFSAHKMFGFFFS